MDGWMIAAPIRIVMTTRFALQTFVTLANVTTTIYPMAYPVMINKPAQPMIDARTRSVWVISITVRMTINAPMIAVRVMVAANT